MAITAEERADIVGLPIAALQAAAPANELNGLVVAYEDGASLEDLAQSIVSHPVFMAEYPAVLTAEEFASRWLGNLIGGEVSDAAMDEAMAIAVGAINSGVSTASLIVQAAVFLNDADTSDPNFGGAAARFQNWVTVATEFAKSDQTGSLDTLQAVLADVSSDPDSVQDALDAIESMDNPGTTLRLSLESAAGADAMRLTGDQDIRIDITANDNQVRGLDLNGDGVISNDGVENNDPTDLDDGIDFEVVDAYRRDLLDEDNIILNFLGDISFDGTGYQGDGVNTDGNIFLGGLGADTALGGIGNDFFAMGGVAASRVTAALNAWIANGGTVANFPGAPGDAASGGRNADGFFAEFSLLDNTDGNALAINGGSTSDDSAVGNNTPQDSDWLFPEVSDDEDGTIINLAVEAAQTVITGVGQTIAGMAEIEHVDASGNLYGLVDSVDVSLGGGGSRTASDENVGIGSTAQLGIIGSVANNILIGGFDNDNIAGGAGNDLLFGGRIDYNNNPNIQDIVNDGVDVLFGGNGNDNLVFELDGGTYEGDNTLQANGPGTDTLWLTEHSFGTQGSADITSDGVVRLDLNVGFVGGLANAAGHGGADSNASGGLYTADQTNYNSGFSRTTTQDIENVIATGLGSVDYTFAGTNDPDLTFNNQQNLWGIDSDLDLRGSSGSNTLYANTGNDVLEGRQGRDLLSGGEGNDTFQFDLQNGDGVDTIWRQEDSDNDNLTEGGFVQDFGVDSSSDFGPSTLTVDFAAADLEEPNNVMTSFSIAIDGVTFAIEDAAALAAVTSTSELASLANEAFQQIDSNVSVSANGDVLTIKDSTPTGGGDISDTPAEGYDVVLSVTAPGQGALGLPVYTAPGETVSLDRLQFIAYENRFDNERVDDDAYFGADSLGSNAYAQDLVVGFDQDGDTILAEGQAFRVNLTNLAVEDEVTITVNDVDYTLTVGRALNGTLIPNETTDAFAARMATYISTFLDDDTASGKLLAATVAQTDPDGSGVTNAEGILITQVAYSDGEETVFMDVTVDVQDNSSLGERARGTVTNLSSTDIQLFEFDGRNNALNETNVEFLGDTELNRAVLETANVEGGTLYGSDAIVVNVTLDGGIDSSAAEGLAGSEIFYNDPANPTTGLAANYALHGDDQLFGDAGPDTIMSGTGDDRIYGSLGLDTIDGGKDLYLDDGVIRVLNSFEASEINADPDTIDIRVLGDLNNNGTNVDEVGLAGRSSVFSDTLVFQQSDFGAIGAGGATFELTLDLSDDQANGGAGKVVVNGDEVNNRTLFTNIENTRLVSGDETLAGQGNDTLDLSVSVDPTDGSETPNDRDTVYFLNNAAPGQVWLDTGFPPSSAFLPATAVLVSVVDGPENVFFGSGDDTLSVDESEAGKNNEFRGGDDDGDDTTDGIGAVDGDAINYSFYVDFDNSGTDNGAPDDAANPSVRFVVNGGGDEVDQAIMTGGLLGNNVATDTIDDFEFVNFRNAAGNVLDNPVLDDHLDVTNVPDSIVDFVNLEVRNGQTGDVEVTFDGGMYDFDVVDADYADTVIVADNMTNSRFNLVAQNVQFDSVLNFDNPAFMDGNDRRTIADLRADNDPLPQIPNIGMYTFNMGPDGDLVDYSNETGNVIFNVQFDGTQASVENVILLNDLRVDKIFDNENLAASQGITILDTTTATSGLSLSFNVDNGPTSTDTALDRDVYRAQLIEQGTLQPIQGTNFLEYYDAGGSATTIQPTAILDRWDAGDLNDRVELTDHESTSTRAFVLRGGDNEANYNELTRSLSATFTIAAPDNADPADFALDGDGQVRAVVGFSDGNLFTPLPGAGTHTIFSYSQQNAVAQGTLRFEATQDAEDLAIFTPGPDKLYIFGEVQDGSDVVTVTVGSPTAANDISLTGFEVFGDSDDNDVYDLTDLERTQDNFILIDNVNPGIIAAVPTILGLSDNDTIKVGDDAIGYDGGPAELTAPNDTIVLEVLADIFGIDFDTLDVTGITDSGVTILGDDDDQDNDATLNALDTDFVSAPNSRADADGDGDTEVARDVADDGGNPETVIVGDLDNIDTIGLFDVLALTDSTDGDTFDVDSLVSELQDGNGDALVAFDTSLDTLDTSRITDRDLTITATGPTAFTLIGSEGNDTITGGGGNDILVGGPGADILNGGTATEVQTVGLFGTLIADGNNATLDVYNPATDAFDLTITESVDFVDGASNDDIGQLLANYYTGAVLADLNGNLALLPGSPQIVDVNYDAATDQFSVEYAPGLDIPPFPLFANYAANADGSVNAFAFSGLSEVNGGPGGADTFRIDALADGGDTISDFVPGTDQFALLETVTGALGDLLDDNADNGALSLLSGDLNPASVQGVSGEGLFLTAADLTGGFAAADLTNLTKVAAAFESQFSTSATTGANADLLMVLESDVAGSFGVYHWAHSGAAGNSSTVFESNELTLLATATGDDITNVTPADFAFV